MPTSNLIAVDFETWERLLCARTHVDRDFIESHEATPKGAKRFGAMYSGNPANFIMREKFSASFSTYGPQVAIAQAWMDKQRDTPLKFEAVEQLIKLMDSLPEPRPLTVEDLRRPLPRTPAHFDKAGKPVPMNRKQRRSARHNKR